MTLSVLSWLEFQQEFYFSGTAWLYSLEDEIRQEETKRQQREKDINNNRK